MIKLINDPVVLLNGRDVVRFDKRSYSDADTVTMKKGSMAYKILSSHDRSSEPGLLKISFDAAASHDITYVGIIQTAMACGLKEFPIPYILTNCHNSLCAVGGTINEDDHLFGLSAAVRFGGDFVPAHLAVIHQYMREEKARCGSMIIGSDSHTRYGALGTMAVGEGGPEIVKQLLGRTYDILPPKVVLVYLEGKPKNGVGPQDVALDLIGTVFVNAFVKDKILEFAGPGIGNLSVDYRNGIDVMTTEASCLSTIWQTDDKVKEYYRIHGRKDDYKEMLPDEAAFYDSCIKIDLSDIEPMIALPFHPSNVYRIRDFLDNTADIIDIIEKDAAGMFGKVIDYSLKDNMRSDGFYADQAVIGGCSGGTYENLGITAGILSGRNIGNSGFSLSIYPASQPVYMCLDRTGAARDLMNAGATVRTAFCGPCFGAGDIPANNTLSIRHNTRNFPNREGSKPGQGQIASVALMDSRSIAVTAACGGRLTPATEMDFGTDIPGYEYDGSIYEKRVYHGSGRADGRRELRYGPNIRKWPEMDPLCEDIILVLASVIRDPVTTTDELIPSGETSAYRSNPVKLAEFALSRKDPMYVERAKKVMSQKKEITKALGLGTEGSDICVGSAIYADKPGDGSAREQAASVQKVLGGWANICLEYATKRYRSNLINWGILPFEADRGYSDMFETDDAIYIKGIRDAISGQKKEIPAKLYKKGMEAKDIILKLGELTREERDILLDGCLINYYRNGR